MVSGAIAVAANQNSMEESTMAMKEQAAVLTAEAALVAAAARANSSANAVPGADKRKGLIVRRRVSAGYGRMVSIGSIATTASRLTSLEETGKEDDSDSESSPEALSDLGSDSEGDAADLAADVPTSGLPSLGSALHASGKCSRCCFYLKNRCRNGINCQFCHLPHERRSRGRGCRGHGNSGRSAAASAAAEQLKSPSMATGVPPCFAVVPNSPSGPPPGLAPPGLPSPTALLSPGGMLAAAGISEASLPPTPKGSTPLLLPPLGPPRGLPQEKHEAPPPPENSPSCIALGSGPAQSMMDATSHPLKPGTVALTVAPSSMDTQGALLATPAPPLRTPQKEAASRMPTGPLSTQPRSEVDKPSIVRSAVASLRISTARSNCVADAVTSTCRPPTPSGAIFGTTPVAAAATLPRVASGHMPPPGLLQQPMMFPRPAAATTVTLSTAPPAPAVPRPAAPVRQSAFSAAAALALSTAPPAPAPVPMTRTKEEEESGAKRAWACAEAEQARPGQCSKPLKVFMPEYECEVPALDPWMPAKKRLPEWTF